MADIHSDFSDSVTSDNDDFGSGLEQDDQIMEEISSPASNQLGHSSSVEVFPTSDFHVLMDGLNKVPYTVYPQNLALCLKAAVSITKHSDRVSQADNDNVRRLIRDAVPSAFDKCLEDSALRRWSQLIQTHIYEANYKLIDLTLVKMQAIFMDEPDTIEAEDDLCPLLQALSQAFDSTCEFHRKHKHDPLPESIDIYKGYTVELERSISISDSEEATSSGPEPETYEHHLWLTNLINYFGQAKGFQVFSEALSEVQATPHKRITLTIVDGMLLPLVQIAHYLTDEAIELTAKGVRCVLNYISAAIDRNIEELSDGGRDRLFLTVSHVLERSVRLIERCTSDIEADSEVAKVHRKFILQLLSISSFNKHLSAVRETNNMLQRAIILKPKDNGNSIRVAVEWLRKNEIVQRLLRANLHQKQYVDQVQKVLKTLSVEGGLQEEHLDLLWNVTGKADTFEVVKNNVYAMLGDLAMGFSPQQLDILFQKFEQCKAWPASDSMKIIELMRRFAKSDERAIMADRVLRLLWNMVMEPNAPVEVLKSGALQEVVHLYDAVGQADYVHDYSLRCVEMIRSDDNVVAALHVLKELVSALSNDTPKQSPSSRMAVVDTLEQQFHIVELVLKNLESLMARKRAEITATTATTTATPQATPGSSTHESAVNDYTEFLLYIGISSSQPFQWEQVQRIWRELVEKPAVPSDREAGIHWFRSAIQKPVITNETAGRVLRELMTSLPPTCLTTNSYAAFLDYFQYVARNDHKVQSTDSTNTAIRILDLQLDGIEYLWQLTMDAPPEIACFAQNHLVMVHLQLGAPLAQSEVKVRKHFLTTCTSRLFRAMELLPQSAAAATDLPSDVDLPSTDDVAAAVRHIDNSLRLLQEMLTSCQGRTMPSVPVHAASYQGPTMKVEVNAATKAQRFPIVVHKNSYVGTLRRIIAQKLNHTPQNIRLLFLGHELIDDARLLRDVSGMSDGAVVTGTFSPVPNAFSVLSPEVARVHEAASPAKLLQDLDVYEPLLQLADGGATAAVRYNAAKLLDMLPTYDKLLDQIRTALDAEEAAGQLYAALRSGGGPARLLYNIQVLSSLLYPIEMAVSPEPSPSDPPTEFLFPTPTTVPSTAVAAQLREQYMSSAGIGVMLKAVNDVQQETKDVDLLRSLHSIVQLLLSRLFAHLHSASSPSATAALPLASTATQAAGNEPEELPEASPSPSSTVVAPPPTPSSAPRSPDINVVSAMLTYLVKLAWDAGRGWPDNRPCGTTTTTSTNNDCTVTAIPKVYSVDADAQLVIDAVRSVSKLVEIQPALVDVIMSDEAVSRMVVENLLNKQYPRVRSSMHTMLVQLSNSPAARTWLLALLTQKLALADSCPRQCLEYYNTLLHVISSISLVAEMTVGQRLLSTLVASLDSSVVPEDGDYRLEGKLLVIVALFRVLDNTGVDSSKLAKRLLTEFLFPEACYLMQSEAERDPQRLERAMHAPCSTRGCRQAALNLLSELMSLQHSVLREGVDLLLKLHFSESDYGLQDWEHIPAQSIRSPDRYVGLKNAGATCYMNAVFQQLYMQPSIRQLLLSAKEDLPKERQDSVFYQLQVMFGHLLLTNSDFYIPRGFWRAFKDYDGEPLNLREHQDAYEFFTRLQDFVDCHMRSRKEQPAIKTVMGGKFAQQIICRSVKYRSEKEEEFYQISLDVRGKRNLKESLDFYVQGELMEGDNQYYCEEVGKKVDAVKRNCIKQLPHTLVIHLKRFEFDYETMTRWKIRDRFEFPQEIDMFPYTVQGLEQREGDEAGAKDVSSSSSDGGPTKRKSYNYELKGMVVHSGTAFAGHYYSYIKTRPSNGDPGTWYCFDDHQVEPWEISNLERDTFGGRSCVDVYDSHVQKNVKQEYDRPNSAYMLFYERCDEPEPVEIDADGCPSGSTAALMNCSPAIDAHKSSGSTQTDGATPRPESMQQDPHVFECEVTDMSLCCGSDVDGVSQDSKKAELPLPYNMPRSIYNSIMTENLRVIHESHLLDRDYFLVVRKLVETNTELCSRKVRRRESSNEGSDGRNPGSAKRRDETDRLAKQTMRLAIQFLFKTYLRSHTNLRDDLPQWRAALVNLMNASPAATKYLLDSWYCVGNSTANSGSGCFLCNSPMDDVRVFMADIIASALKSAVTNDDGTVDLTKGPQDKLKGTAYSVDAMVEALRDFAINPWRVSEGAIGGEAAKALYDYCALGPIHRAHVATCDPAAWVKSLIDRTIELSRAVTKRDTICELVNIVRLDSVMIRRLNLAVYLSGETAVHAIDNLFRVTDEQPVPVDEYLMKSINNPKFVNALMSEFVLTDPEAVELARFLSWEAPQISVQFLEGVANLAFNANPQDLSHISTALAQILTVRDKFLLPRLSWIFVGKSPPNTRGGILHMAIRRECTAQRRLQLMRLVINVHEAVPDALKECLGGCSEVMDIWSHLCTWLADTVEQQRNNGNTPQQQMASLQSILKDAQALVCHGSP